MAKVNIIESVSEYVRFMLEKVGGLKVLILDKETQSIISVVYTQSQVLENEVFLLHGIDKDDEDEGGGGGSVRRSEDRSVVISISGRSNGNNSKNVGKLRHLNALYFIRPTYDNFIILFNELKHPKYNEYHLFFTARVDEKQIKRLAKVDEFEVVKQVHELYADIVCVNEDVYTLNIQSTSCLLVSQPPASHAMAVCANEALSLLPTSSNNAIRNLNSSSNSKYEEEIICRIIDGIMSILFILRVVPSIKYSNKSNISAKIANFLLNRIHEQQNIFETFHTHDNYAFSNPSSLHFSNVDTARKNECILLLFDRRDDPLTPLLNQWTYQAMLHELIGIENNRVNLKKFPGVRSEFKEIVLQPNHDTFYKNNLNANFGELGIAVKKYLENFQEQTKKSTKIESISDMQKFVEDFPEYQKLSGNVTKHVTVVHELSKIVESNHLLDISELEQNIACSNEQKLDNFSKNILDFLKDEKINKLEKLRLALIFSLRCEKSSLIAKIKEELSRASIDEEQICLIDTLIQFGGSDVRNFDLFKSKNIFSITKDTIQRGISGAPNVYSQHKSLLYSIVDSLIRGKMKENKLCTAIPRIRNFNSNFLSQSSFNLSTSVTNITNKIPPLIVVFVLGGCTYKEAYDLKMLSEQMNNKVSIILGGTYIHNTKSFLADLTQIIKNRMKSAEFTATNLNANFNFKDK